MLRTFARGRPHLQSGTAHVETGDYESAVAERERGREVSQRPALGIAIVDAATYGASLMAPRGGWVGGATRRNFRN